MLSFVVLALALCVCVSSASADANTTRLSNLSQQRVLADVPVIFGGFDIVSYWTVNRAVSGRSTYATTITKKDQNGVARQYEMQFSNQANLDTFKGNMDHYMFQYGGFCDWGICCELSPQWPWTAKHMGPPGGFNSNMHGWRQYNSKLYVAFNTHYSNQFFAKASDITKADSRWTSFFGSLTEGVLNYMCLSYERAQYQYCIDHGQPLAPPADPSQEIFPTIPESELPTGFIEFQRQLKSRA